MNRTFLFNPDGKVHIRHEDRDYELTDLEQHPCWAFQEYGDSAGWYKSFEQQFRNGDISIDWDECEEEEVPESIRMKFLLLRS